MVGVLAERSAIDSLAAVLRMAYEGPARKGTFDAVALYQAPRRLRLTAYKDLVLATHDVFDLAIGPRWFGLEYEPEGADAPARFRGPAEALPREHPRFSGFFWAGEALFRPGAGAAARVVADDGRRVIVEALLPSGALARWTARRDTLEVLSGEVRSPQGAVIELTFGDYRRLGAAFVPGRVTFADRAGGVRIEVRVKELEVDPPLEPADLTIGAGE